MTKILLVEDDKSLREIYGVRLLAEGYDIVSAGDGEEALAMAIKERPNLIVSDVMMPKISGFDMLDILRSTTETKNIKVIMMTALSSEDQRARGEALGADRYLVKSQVGIEDVVRTVHDVLADAPVATPSPTQTFGGPAASTVYQRSTPTPTVPQRPPMPPQTVPSAAPEPQTPSQPSPPQNTQYQQPAQQQQQQQQQQFQSANTPTIQSPPARPATSQTSVATPSPSSLPQPTAPFSTARPANLGDRIIHPITPQGDAKPDISHLMAQELSGSPTPQPTPPPAPPQPGYTLNAPGVDFEETPHPAPQAPSYPPTPGPQPPQFQ